ncbi:MAG: DUF4157 domain-containing protein, partial [Spirulina sp. SIO3F2]|nr:DUF4157 domain-containing protein [Spirulina sp. SIO3F2]
MAHYQPLQPHKAQTVQKKKQSEPTSGVSERHPSPINYDAPRFQPGVLQRNAGLTPSEPSATAALPLQPRLAVGQVNDPYEQEADCLGQCAERNRVARQVVNQIQRPQMQAQAIAPIADLQAKGNLDGGTVSSDVERGINQARGGGQPLSAKTQSQMGGAIGADFSQVRVHTSNHADQLNQAVQARAFTTGPDIFFKKG